MIKINFSYDGGFPFDQDTVDKIQSAHLDIFASFIGFLKIPDVGNHVLFGCRVLEGNITSGMMYIDGDLCSFVGVEGDLDTKIKKQVTVEDAPFENGTNNPVFRYTTAVVDAAGVPLSGFTRHDYVATDNNYTTPEKNKLAGIAAGAEVNVQANWEDANPASDAFILNKPTGMLEQITDGVWVVGNISANETTITLTFNDPIDTDNYMIVSNFVSLNANLNDSNDFTFVVGHRTTNGFDILLEEIGGSNTQNLIYYYKIFAL